MSGYQNSAGLTGAQVDARLSQASSAVQPGDTIPIADGGTGATTAEAARTALGLGTASTTAATSYATAAQGSTADTAVQPGDTIPIADGGTGATTVAAAQTALISDSSEIGAALADGDHIPVVDATDSTAKKSLVSRVYDYVRGKLLGVANTWTANQTINGYTKLGESAPAIKCKKLTGTMPASSQWGIIAHGLDSTKIVSFTAIVSKSNGASFAAEFTAHAGSEFSIYLSPANFYLLPHATNSADILSGPFIILIWYEE